MPYAFKNLMLSFFLLSFLYACNLTGDYVLEDGSLKVYYDQESIKSTAASFAAYWKKENYLGDREQSIKLVLDENSQKYEVRIILRKDFNPKEKLAFNELQILERIQHDLNANVFKAVPCELVICDNKFQVLQKPHPINLE
jgi:hypothetical protein